MNLSQSKAFSSFLKKNLTLFGIHDVTFNKGDFPYIADKCNPHVYIVYTDRKESDMAWTDELIKEDALVCD